MTKKLNINRDYLIKGCIFFALFCILTCAIKTLDVSAIGPEGSSVGFSSLNDIVRKTFPYDKGAVYLTISEVLMYVSFCAPLFSAFIAMKQMIQRRSLFKIDNCLWYTALLYAAVLGLYFLFDHVLIVNMRPVLVDGVLKPSYPSSHSLGALIFYFSGAIIAKKNNKMIAGAVMKLLGVLVCVFRCICGIHWFTDIVGAIMLSLALLNFYEAFVFAERKH